MAAVIKSVSFDAADALTLARFWAAALGSAITTLCGEPAQHGGAEALEHD